MRPCHLLLSPVTRRFIVELNDNIGPYTDIPAPDVNTNAQTMALIYDTYDTMHKGQNNLGVVTGKPVHIGGSFGRREATGRGGLFATRRALFWSVLPGVPELDGLNVVIQGFGNVGSVAATLFHEAGARIVAVSDSRGGGARPLRPVGSEKNWPLNSDRTLESGLQLPWQP